MDYCSFIDGQWHDGHGQHANLNPSDLDDTIGLAGYADAALVDEAVQAARRALPAWALSLPAQRAEMLQRIANALAERKDALGELLAREEGKTLPEAIGEVGRAAQIFGFFAGECLRGAGELLPSVRPGVAVEITREPVGVCALITPWNFPIAIPAWKIAPALAHGNCVVFKPAELVPASAVALARIIEAAGVPRGVFNLVLGAGAVGAALVNHPGVDAVSFTGSQATGAAVAAATLPRLARVQLEMGGKNPQLVLDDADLDVAVNVCVQSAFFSTGQRCTAASRLIVTEGIYPRLVAALTARTAALKVGHALQAGTEIGPVADERQLAKDLNAIAAARAAGATLACGGQLLQREHRGHYLAPALFVDTTPEMAINRDEIFGPVASVLRVRDYDEALAVANDTPFGLSAGIATSSLKYASHFKRHAQAGMVMVNLPTAGVDYHVPFGGRKGSSHGPREQGRMAAEFYTVVKTAYTWA